MLINLHHKECRMKIETIFCLILVLANLSCAVTVYTLDEQFSSENQTVLRFRIENNSVDTLKNIELRYQVLQATSQIAEPDLYYLPDGMANWSFEDSVHATLVIYFPNVVLYPGDTLGGSSGYAVGLHNKDWSAWTKNDDPSQPASNKFSMTNNVEVLSGGNSIRQEVGMVSGCPVVQFVEITASSVSLQVLHRLNSDSSSVVVKNKDGLSVTANLNDALTDSLNYYGSNRVYIQTNFAGTIIAPNAEVVIGQSGKEFYGAIFAKSIVVHQNTKITWVPFVSNSLNTTLAMTGYDRVLNYKLNFFAK